MLKCNYLEQFKKEKILTKLIFQKFNNNLKQKNKERHII